MSISSEMLWLNDVLPPSKMGVWAFHHLPQNTWQDIEDIVNLAPIWGHNYPRHPPITTPTSPTPTIRDHYHLLLEEFSFFFCADLLSVYCKMKFLEKKFTWTRLEYFWLLSVSGVSQSVIFGHVWSSWGLTNDLDLSIMAKPWPGLNYLTHSWLKIQISPSMSWTWRGSSSGAVMYWWCCSSTGATSHWDGLTYSRPTWRRVNRL